MLKLFNQLVIGKRCKKSPNRQLTKLPHLVPEIWEQIFFRVPRGQLLKLRQTCHYWRNIVDGSPVLRDRLHVKISHNGDHHTEPWPIPPVGRFSFEFDSFEVISDVGSWWPKVGEFVTVLCLGRCEFPVGMMRHTPNLKQLQLFYVKFVEFENLDFKLHKVQELTVEYVDPDILKVLGQVITNLRTFNFNGSVMDASKEADEERNELKFVAEQLDVMERNVIRWSRDIKECFHNLKRVTTNPQLFGEAIFFTEPRVVRQARIDPTHEELDMFRGLRDISEKELVPFILRYPGLKELMLVNCEAVCEDVVEQLCPILNQMKKHSGRNCQPTSESSEYKLTYWWFPETVGRTRINFM